MGLVQLLCVESPLLHHRPPSEWLLSAISTRHGGEAGWLAHHSTHSVILQLTHHPGPRTPRAALLTRAQLRPATPSYAHARYSREIEKAHKGRVGVTWALCLATVKRRSLARRSLNYFPITVAPL